MPVKAKVCVHYIKKKKKKREEGFKQMYEGRRGKFSEGAEMDVSYDSLITLIRAGRKRRTSERVSFKRKCLCICPLF